MDTKVKVHYDQQTGRVLGYFPNRIQYNYLIPEPFIEIEEVDQDKTGKEMAVVNGIYQEFQKPEAQLIAEAKAAKKEQINNQRDANIARNVFYKINNQDHHFQRDIMANLAWVNNIEAMDDVAVSNWVTADNAIVSLNKADLLSICNHIRQRDTNEVIQARKRKDALYSLSTLAEVEAFDISQIYEV